MSASIYDPLPHSWGARVHHYLPTPAEQLQWLRQQWHTNPQLKQMLLTLAAAYKKHGERLLPTATLPGQCSRQVLRQALQGIIRHHLV